MTSVGVRTWKSSCKYSPRYKVGELEDNAFLAVGTEEQRLRWTRAGTRGSNVFPQSRHAMLVEMPAHLVVLHVKLYVCALVEYE